MSEADASARENDACVIRSFVEPLTKEMLPQNVRKKTNAVANNGPRFTSEMSPSRTWLVVRMDAAAASSVGGGTTGSRDMDVPW